MAITVRLPILVMYHHVFMPGETHPVGIGRAKSSALVDFLKDDFQDSEGPHCVTICQKNEDLKDLRQVTEDDIYLVGTACDLRKVIKRKTRTDSEGNRISQYNVVLRGLQRVRLLSLEVSEDISEPLWGEFEIMEPVIDANPASLHAMDTSLRETAREVIHTTPEAPNETLRSIEEINNLSDLTDFLVSHLELEVGEKQEFLEEVRVFERADNALRLLTNHLTQAEMSEELRSKMREEADKTQREYYLRQQLKAIREQLGEDDDGLEELERRIEEAQMPEEAYEAAMKQYNRLSSMQSSSSEYSVTLNYIETMLDVPWGIYSEDNLDLKRAQEILDEDHYGLDKVKDRVVEYLAVRSLKDNMKGPILCFHGPPGVGKTSVAKSIARTMGRKFARISLGGVHDESEIRGHRRTYVGALPGRIVRALQKCGTQNPVILLDEIDKVGADFRGDPAAALLEVLDPAQNHTFSDHYLDVDLDLSKVLFIATANRMDTISPPLRDRMEVLDVPSYTQYEKAQIASKYLLPKQLENHGLDELGIQFSDDSIALVIDKYTREAGVRSLNRRLADLCRQVAVEYAMLDEDGRNDFSCRVDSDYVKEALGPIRHISEVAQREDQAGVATGLAWTQVGGDILFIEVQAMEGNGKITLTGQLGDVMKESVRAALSYIRGNALTYGIETEELQSKDLHVHVPAGSIPKDGPSAGITMFTAILSRLSYRPVRHDVAMTGEITLSGHILPVGGIREKVIAAHRAGIREVIMPAICKKDLIEVDESVLDDMTFHYVKRVEELPPLVFRKVTEEGVEELLEEVPSA